MYSWWNCLAKEVNNRDKETMRPPETAVSLVLFLLHKAIEIGDRRREVDKDIGESQSRNMICHQINIKTRLSLCIIVKFL